jgi:hypothetical protein
MTTDPTYTGDPTSSEAVAIAWMLRSTAELATQAVHARAHLAAADPASPVLGLLDALPAKLAAAIPDPPR